MLSVRNKKMTEIFVGICGFRLLRGVQYTCKTQGSTLSLDRLLLV